MRDLAAAAGADPASFTRLAKAWVIQDGTDSAPL